MKEKISTRQLAVITAVGFTVTKLHALPAMLAGMAGESLWIAAAINLIADFILLCAALKITAKYPDCDLFGAVKNEIGKIPAQIIFVTYAVYFLVCVFRKLRKAFADNSHGPYKNGKSRL